MISVTSKMSQSDFIKFNYYLSYTKPIMLILTLLGYVFLILTGLHFMGMKGIMPISPLYVGPFGAVIGIYAPISLYFRSRKLFLDNQFLQDDFKYDFDEAGITITCDAFNVNTEWDKIYRIRKLNNWILIYQTQVSANLIMIESFKPGDYDRLKDLVLNKASNVKADF